MSRLTHAKIAKLNKPGMFGDGGDGGLWLIARALKSGDLSRRFVFRFRIKGRYFELPVGPFPDVGLVDARAKASEFRAAIARGDNPVVDRQSARSKVIAPGAITFRQATIDYAESVGKGRWRTLDHYQDWMRTFELHVWPGIGNVPIGDITDHHAHAVLSPLFKRSPRLGRCVASRSKAVFDRARVMKLTTRDNPFQWSGYLGLVYPAPPATKHRGAVDWRTMPELYARLSELGDQPTALAQRFAIALALRPGEARMAKFDMIDVSEKTYTLTMTKNGKKFVAPLNQAALDVVERGVELRVNDFLFPGRAPNRPINDTAQLDLVKVLCGPEATAHGIARSCFSDYCYENDVATDSVIEACLNHATPGGQTVRAYKRGSQLELRRALMNRYSDFLLRQTNVVAFPASATG